jgi:hypothetical protein
MRLAEHLVQPHHAYAGGFMHLMTGIARTRILHSR